MTPELHPYSYGMPETVLARILELEITYAHAKATIVNDQISCHTKQTEERKLSDLETEVEHTNGLVSPAQTDQYGEKL